MKSKVSQGIGNFSGYTLVENGIEVQAAQGLLRLTFFEPAVVKVSITRDDYDDFSYAVISSPSKVEFQLEDQASSLHLRTDLLQIVVQKSPVSIRFETLTGTIINEDEPGLATSWIGDQVATYKKLQPGERFIGLGEKTGPLDRKGAAYLNWNTDAYGYHGGSDPLYCSIPFYTGIHQGLVYGIYFDNSYKTFYNFGASNNRFASFAADGGSMNYFFIHGGNVSELIEKYTSLTGRMDMPPLWSLGYQQCRYSYYPDKEVYALSRTFREKNIPADVIVLDIHHMNQYKIFTWDNQNFPNPKALIDHLRENGFRVVVIFDPGIKIEEGYAAYDEGKIENVFLQYPDGKNYEGQVWPGWCHFPDFTNPKARDWWADQMKVYTDLGLDGYWNDMNEIATWGQSLPENIEFDFDGNKTTTRQGRNVYGLQMARSTYEGARKHLNGRRPFNLTRSGFSGVQRYGAVWTGDNVSYDEHLLLGVRLVTSLGLSGVAFAGYDAGGFVGEASPRLFARWISVASLSPFFRGHTMINTKDAEPWSFGEEVEQISRNYIRLRYQLMPYIYSLFHEAATTGKPLQRSLALDYPFEARVFDHAFHNQYLFGPFILVVPVESNKDVLKVFLPEGEWYFLYTGKKYSTGEHYIESPIHKLPVFMKEGALLPMKKSGINTASEKEDFILHVYAGKNDSRFEWYEDDGATFSYEEGAYSIREISYQPADRKITIAAAEGTYVPSWKSMKVILHGFDSLSSMKLGSNQLTVSTEEHSYFSPLEKFDPFNEPNSMGSEATQQITFPFTTRVIEITW